MSRSKNNRPTIDTLEARTMLSAAALSVYSNGSELVINGTTRHDAITVEQTAEGLRIGNTIGKVAWSTTVAGSFNSIKIDAGRGNDKVAVAASVTTDCKINGGIGNDILAGGSGDDTFVNVGNGSDRMTGAAGTDSFWGDSRDGIADASAAELNAGNVHKIAAFESIKTTTQRGTKTTTKITRIGLEPKGEKLVDPTVTEAGISYKNFSGSKLFADAGPAADDVNQGYVGDCYFLATLSSVADTNANTIKQSVVELGDGTYAVRFFRGNQQVFVRVDGDLPTWSNGRLAYADTGAEGSIWTAVMEKAFAVFRTGANSYASIESGWMSEAYAALGKVSNSTWSAADGSQLLNVMKTALDSGKSVTYACYEPTDGAPLIGYHAYSVVSVDTAAQTVTLRNPWGIDGAGYDGSNDGYVTLSAAQAHNAFMGLMTAWV